MPLAYPFLCSLACCVHPALASAQCTCRYVRGQAAHARNGLQAASTSAELKQYHDEYQVEDSLLKGQVQADNNSDCEDLNPEERELHSQYNWLELLYSECSGLPAAVYGDGCHGEYGDFMWKTMEGEGWVACRQPPGHPGPILKSRQF